MGNGTILSSHRDNDQLIPGSPLRGSSSAVTTACAGQRSVSPFCHDGTERRIPRPQNPDEQQSHYSGKKKSHTVKNLLLSDRQVRIVSLSPTVAGTRHDKKIADASPSPLPLGSLLLQDLGFLAFTLEGVTTCTPHRTPRGGQLTDEQKADNRLLASCRVRSEHVNRSVKRCRILKDSMRLRRVGTRDQVMEIGCSLHNFRVRLSPWLPMCQPR